MATDYDLTEVTAWEENHQINASETEHGNTSDDWDFALIYFYFSLLGLYCIIGFIDNTLTLIILKQQRKITNGHILIVYLAVPGTLVSVEFIPEIYVVLRLIGKYQNGNYWESS